MGGTSHKPGSERGSDKETMREDARPGPAGSAARSHRPAALLAAGVKHSKFCLYATGSDRPYYN